MRTLTLFSTTDLHGSIQILPVLFRRVIAPREVASDAVADLLRAGGARPFTTVSLDAPDGIEPNALIPLIETQLRAGAGRIILDHATGALFLDRLYDDKRQVTRVGLIQEAFMTTFRADVTRARTLAVAIRTRAPKRLALALSRAIPSMSPSEAREALTKPTVLMTFAMLIDLIVAAITLAADNHDALNAGTVSDDLPLTAEDILSGLTIEPFTTHQDVA